MFVFETGLNNYRAGYVKNKVVSSSRDAFMAMLLANNINNALVLATLTTGVFMLSLTRVGNLAKHGTFEML